MANWMLHVTWALALMWIAHGRVGLWILNLFQQFWSNPILFGRGTDTIGKFVSSSFRAYVEHTNPILYASCTSI
jgi:hypothetical protein